MPNNHNNITNGNTWPFILSPVPSLLANVPQNNVSSLIPYNSNRHLSSAPQTAIATISSDSALSDFNNLNLNANDSISYRPNTNSANSPLVDISSEINSELNSNIINSNHNNRLLDI